MKLALAQMLVEPGAREANVARALDRISAAAANGAEAVLLPECLDLGWTHPSARELATPVPDGDTCRRLRAAARRHGLFVCAGFVERAEERLFNAAVFIGSTGELLLHHRKINELDFGRELYATGDRLGVVDTPHGRIGLMICADGFAPGQAIGRSLALMGAEIILSPCAWAVPAEHDNRREPYGQIWRDNYGAICRDFEVTIAGCSNVGPITAGPWCGRKCIGNSMVFGPGGENRLLGPYGERADELLLVEVQTGISGRLV
ncbi:MAG TPA: carbon-nitrogen hydrolase family protein [Verrucomicrobiales bacterium]|nr:carbon-nitrogen hydrolase family protein [Verrucomicrobiales bacterium]